MKKTTSKNFTKRLAQYSALSVAIAGISETNAQIVHQDVDPDFGGAGQTYALDLNGDGTNDFKISGNYLPPPNSASAALTLSAYTANAASFLGSQPGYAYPFALDNGETISSGRSVWIGNGIGNLNFAGCTGSNSNWCNVTDKYLGLRVNVANGPGPGDDETFYGWARLNVDASGVNWVIKDYAYNSTSGASLTADHTLDANDPSLASTVKIVTLNKTIGLYNLPQKTNYTVYNISGQRILRNSISKVSHTIEATSLSTGIYIVEIEDNDTKAKMRKKVIL